MASQYSPAEAESNINYFKAFAKELEAEADGKQTDWLKEEKLLMHYFKLAEQDLLNDLDIGELEQEERSLKIESLYSSVPPYPAEVTDVVKLLIKNGKYVRALILLKWANEYGNFDKPYPVANKLPVTDFEHENMSQMILQAYYIIRKNISKTDLNLMAIAVNYGEPLMVEMYGKMKQMQLPDIEAKVRSEAISCHLITSVRGFLEMSEEAIESGKESIAMLEKQFGKDAKYIQTFGHALTVIGLAYKQLGETKRGDEKLEESYLAKTGATDFRDEGTRAGYIRYTKWLQGGYDFHDEMI